ncbi:J domain-containing protein [Geomonas sp. Red32]|uniref:J domain-containing protein n=1 Tax=Geomonas sp. Red32 TaxID=2912856 RepID=UPI00202CB48B|nr:J domain-containing protein [Geomonas sp. Red32]MCM0084148.1 J domain-containing protein [Geomonas sp. Red32]
MTYRELKAALAVFGLEERATLADIKSRHRELVKRYHPDTGQGEDDPAQIRKINTAYQVLMEYLQSYRFSFSEQEFYEQNADERLRRQFMDDMLWGGGRVREEPDA